MGKILIKESNGLISVIRTLFRRKQRLSGSMLTLNAVVETQMLYAQVTKIRQLPQKTQSPLKLQKLIFAGSKLKLYEIAEELKIAEGSVFTILHEHLSMRKLCSKWVLHLFTVDKKKHAQSAGAVEYVDCTSAEG